MGKYAIGRNVKIEVAATYGAGKVVSAITKADPGVASSTAHGLLALSVGYLDSVEGMVQLDGQAVRVKTPLTDSFQLEGLDTTNFPTFTDSALFVPVLTWQTLANSTSYNIGGGEGEKQDATTLLDIIKKEENGLLAAQSVSMNVRSEQQFSAAMRLVEKAALAQTKMIVRITLDSGAQRLFYGTPSLPGEDVQLGQLGTGSLAFTVSGRVLYLD